MSNGKEESEKIFKIVVAGNSGVGKTNLVARYVDDEFDETYKTTIGLDFKFKETAIIGETCRIQIWDTAGQEKLKAVAASYYRNANGIAIIFDITNRESFDKLDFWISEANSNVPENTPFIVIGNKNDLIDQRKVSIEEAKDFVSKRGYYYVETSAKTNKDDCVSKAFDQLVGEMLNKRNTMVEAEYKQEKLRKSQMKLSISKGAAPVEAGKKGCC